MVRNCRCLGVWLVSHGLPAFEDLHSFGMPGDVLGEILTLCVASTLVSFAEFWLLSALSLRSLLMIAYPFLVCGRRLLLRRRVAVLIVTSSCHRRAACAVPPPCGHSFNRIANLRFALYKIVVVSCGRRVSRARLMLAFLSARRWL